MPACTLSPGLARVPCSAMLIPVPSARSSPQPWLRHLALLALLVNLVGCGLFEARDTSEPAPQRAPLVAPVPHPPRPDDTTRLRGHLYQHYQLWKGTPYRLGGMTTRGIDCSGFVLVTFKALLDQRLPRTVDEQATLGSSVAPDDLRSGDLVFFKTGPSMRHVGIYMDHGRFMHASTRRGVMISGLSDSYWSRRFWQARRIRPPLLAHQQRGTAQTANNR